MIERQRYFKLAPLSIKSDKKTIYYVGAYSFEDRCPEVLSRISDETTISKCSFIYYNKQKRLELIELINEQRRIIMKNLLRLRISTSSHQFEEAAFLTDDVTKFVEWVRKCIKDFKENEINEFWVDISCLTKLHTFILLKMLKEKSCFSRIFYTTPKYYGKRPTEGISEPIVQIPFTMKPAAQGIRWGIITILGKEETRCFRIIQEFNPEIAVMIWPKLGDFHCYENYHVQQKQSEEFKRLLSISYSKDIFLDFRNIDNAKNAIRACLEEIVAKKILNCAITNLGPRSASVTLAVLSQEMTTENWQKGCVRYAYVKPSFYRWREYSKGIGNVWEVFL